MKKMIFATLLTLITTSAFAAPVTAILTEAKATRNLTKLEPKLIIKNIINATATKNDHSIKLSILVNIPCAKGKVCPRVARVNRIEHELSITEVRNNECDTTYVATTLNASVPAYTITLVDKELSSCPETADKLFVPGTVSLEIKDLDQKKDALVKAQVDFKVQRFIRALNHR